MKNKLTITILALTLTLILAACGAPAKPVLNVTTTEQGFDSPSYTVPAGAVVTLNMKNDGALEHEFAIIKLGQHVEPPFGEKDEDKILWELDGVAAGTTKSDTFTAPTEPGEYDVICGIPGHIEMGMVSKLIVK